MRKRVSKQSQEANAQDTNDWLDLEQLAQVEVTSEDSAYPVEAALLPGLESGWRAGEPGEQRIRLLFDDPQTLRRILLVFEVAETRTQEFVLRWSAPSGETHEIVRQQYNFSVGGTAQEVEDYKVSLEGVEVLELAITPDISGGEARASLERLRLA